MCLRSGYETGSGSGSKRQKTNPNLLKNLLIALITLQCLGFGSVGSARFWLPGSGSDKICGFTDPDLRGKISTKNFENS